MTPIASIFPVARTVCDPAIAAMRLWKQEEFQNSEAQWQDLLARSTADPLFMSWSWQWTWWRHHAALLKSHLYLVAAYSADGKLVGLAPFHFRRAAHRKPLSAMRLEIIGSTWRNQAGAYSEYLDFIVDTRFEDAFLGALADVVLRDHDWSDLIIANSKRCSVAARFVHKYLEQTCYVREVDPLIAQLALLPQDFANYVQTLHSGARRKVWHQRARLPDAQLGRVMPDRLNSMFDVLNDFHERRWGMRQYLGSFRDFHVDFARLCADRGTLQMSALNINGKPISVMYNVRIGAMEYNIQSGFDPTIGGISPGYLHFGFCIEAACSEGVRRFDFLAGDGRSRNYKRDFITQETALITFQCIRMRPLAWLYKEYDRRALGTIVPCAASVVLVFDCNATIANNIEGVGRFIS